MKRMKTAVRRFQRMRIRTQSLICCAIILGMFAAILLVMGLDSSELLVNSGRIVAFRLDEISDNGETLQLTGVDGQSIALSRPKWAAMIISRLKDLQLRTLIFVCGCGRAK